MTNIVLRSSVVLLAFGGLTVPAVRAAEDTVPSFKSRGDMEKKFVASVAKAILKAAHPTGLEPTMEKYAYEEVKKGRTKLTIQGTYKGAATRKVYKAEIIVHLDTADKDSWEVLRIEFNDNNNIPYSRKRVDDLIKQLNRKE